MNFEDYWTLLNAKRPIPFKGKIVMTAEQFKAILKQTWERADRQRSVFDKVFGKDRF
jgi:hypothetical protein